MAARRRASGVWEEKGVWRGRRKEEGRRAPALLLYPRRRRPIRRRLRIRATKLAAPVLVWRHPSPAC
jgi:hypothetical protein